MGRNPAASVHLEGRTVSWQHAEIQCSPAGARILDLGSTNGVFANGVLVKEAPLEDGLLIRIGGYLALVVDERNARLGAEFACAGKVGIHVGRALGAALAPLRAAAAGQQPLVIQGEIGTGKTLAARLLHAESGRAGDFVVVDCDSADAPARLLGQGEPGPAFDEARGGTLVLRTIEGLPAPAQDDLAAVLSGEAGRAVRCLVTTQEPLDAAVDERRLGSTLRERLDGVTVKLPSLRQRIIEIPGLFRWLLDARGGDRPRTVSPELVERLCLYDWPCNVRELALVVTRLLALYGDEDRLRASHLPTRMQLPLADSTTSPVTPVPRIEVTRLLEAVRASHGNLARAASRLGISRERAYRLMDGIGQPSGHLDG